MAYVDWAIKGPKIGGCSCDYGCPCEFNGRPSQGYCEGLEAMRIDEGWFGDLRLDGLVVAASYRWPGRVNEGGGVAKGFIDARASEQKIDALFKILGGEEQEPTTVFNIYGSTMDWSGTIPTIDFLYTHRFDTRPVLVGDTVISPD